MTDVLNKCFIIITGCYLALISFASFSSHDFLLPTIIKSDVDFWAKVYRDFDTHQVVFYDSKTKVVYDILDLPTVPNELSSNRYKKNVQQRFKEIEAIIKDAVSKTDQDNEDSIVANIKKNGLLKEPDLVERLKVQNGLRAQFEQGLKISGRYIEDMKAVLKWQDLPDELMAIVFVESLFNLSTVSHAGAVGPWGIVKETALRSGIHVNNFTDERLDWVVATYCAAQFIKRAKGGLSSWPLVITAYNYGYPGMMRAVNIHGQDFESVIKNHTSPIFGYASKSYYSEFMAALDTIKHQDKYFPELKKEPRFTYDTVKVDRPIEVSDVISLGVLSRNIKYLNPALTTRTLAGHEVFPSDYSFRIPLGKADIFYKKIKKIDHKKRQRAAQKISVRHKARQKETLFQIAKKYNILPKYLSEKLNRPLDYKPNGTVFIRSEAHNFSLLISINDSILSLTTGNQLTKP